MSSRLSHLIATLLLAGLAPLTSAQAETTLPRPLHLTVAQGMSKAMAAALLLPARRYFTGQFAGRAGDGRAISFVAMDNYTIPHGQIIANWHLEDNLTLMQQLGPVARN